LNALGAGIVIRDTIATSIIERIKKKEGNYFIDNSFAKYVSPQHFFDKDGLLTTSWKGFVNEKDDEHKIKYYLNKQMCPKGFAWIKLSDIPKNTQILPTHKIFISKAYNGGDAFPHQIIGKPFYGEPGSVCSQTYLVIGYNHNFTKTICENIISYMTTKFFRYMVFIKKKTQDNPSAVFQFVPPQDFSKSWTDVELYSKYDLTDAEVSFIESIIKPME
jgi:site-specific DNA-methyltransferase (adenine-specific)